jgi:hypothetical protein
MLLAHPEGQYHFLQGIAPYSCGVVADPGYEIVHATLEQPLPWRRGFDWIEAYLGDLGRGRGALCAVELRSPAPFSMRGFIDFNRAYCAVLESWGLYVGGLNPVARTNVAPRHEPPEAVALHGFSYTVPSPPGSSPTLIVAGAGELRGGILEAERIIRPGDTCPAAMREKAVYVMSVMEERLRGLGGGWGLVTAVDVYTVHLQENLLEDTVLPGLGAARRHGLRWHCARPPVLDIDFEMDLRGVRTEQIL